MLERAKEVLGGRCLPLAVSADEDGRIACSMVEAVQASRACDATLGRSEVDESVMSAVTKQLQAAGLCGGASAVDCDAYSLCHIDQLSGPDLETCQTELDYPDSALPGFCYLDAAQGLGNEALLTGCPATEQRKLRFVGDDTPRAGAINFIICGPAND